MGDDILTQLQNDIVFRLRLQAKVSNLYEIQHPHMVRIPTIYEEAADEIERLRIEVQYLKTPCPRCDYEDRENARQLEIVRKVETDRDMWREALLHGVANLDNQCKGCEICEFIKSKHEEIGGMR